MEKTDMHLTAPKKELLSLDDEEGSSSGTTIQITPPELPNKDKDVENVSPKETFLSRLLNGLKKQKRSELQETLEHFIESANSDDTSISAHEHVLITNVLKLQNVCAKDVMVPRTDISAADVDCSLEELCKIITESQHSRLCIYRETLDEIIGTVHIKDLLLKLVSKEEFEIHDLCRSVPIVSPAMPVLDLLLEMRESKKHMVLVIDEYGGIDGLVTIGDIIEDIVGNIDDEYDAHDEPQIIENADGSVISDAMVELDDFEERFGKVFTEEDHEDNNTLAGLVISIAGRVPVRGEILMHDASAMEFEVLDADLRRINRLRIKNIPDQISS